MNFTNEETIDKTTVMLQNQTDSILKIQIEKGITRSIIVTLNINKRFLRMTIPL